MANKEINKAKGAKRKSSAQKGRLSPSQSVSISPLAPKYSPKLPPLAGIRLATAETGIHYTGRTDLLLVTLSAGTQIAGLFTQSKTASAPVDWCKEQLPHGKARALVVNAGNANAFTGAAGKKTVEEVAATTASVVGCTSKEIFLASTGVIGEALSHQKMTRALSNLGTSGSAGDWHPAAQAIMTTDTFPKLATEKVFIEGRSVTINGIAKGSGMIAPDMATMLAFIFTDANLPASVLQQILTEGAKTSFNSITVDSDTSTSDTLLLFATGKGGRHSEITRANDKKLSAFKKALGNVLLNLALQIVRDGEGASKLIQIDVKGAADENAARNIAMAIAKSPLVKTAIAGGDANWGRVVMAVGKAGEEANRDKMKIIFGRHLVAENGVRSAQYDEGKASKAVSGQEVKIIVDVGVGKASSRVWTCDLTEGYVDINTRYRS